MAFFIMRAERLRLIFLVPLETAGTQMRRSQTSPPRRLAWRSLVVLSLLMQPMLADWSPSPPVGSGGAGSPAAVFSGRELAAGRAHGSSGTCYGYEWGGIFATPTDAGQVYTWTAHKVGGAFTEPHMNVVFLPVDDFTEATLTAAMAEAINGMSHMPCTAVQPGDTIEYQVHACSMLHFGDIDPATFTLSNAVLFGGHVAVFTEYDPAEFAVRIAHT